MSKTNEFIGCLSVLAILLLVTSEISVARVDIKPPFLLKEYELSISDPQTKKALIHFSAELIASGDVKINLHLPKEIITVSPKLMLRIEKLTKGNIITRDWELTISKDGYFLIQVALAFSPTDLGENLTRYSRFHSYPLYIEIKDGAIINYSRRPDPKYTNPPRRIEKPSAGQKPIPTPIPFDSTVHGKVDLKPSRSTMGTMNYTITVQISGKILYPHGSICYAAMTKGIPGAHVELDWDADNDPSTAWTPYYFGVTRHIDYDITDMDGAYYFSFSFTSENPANQQGLPGQVAQSIRVYSTVFGGAGFNGSTGIGIGASFPVSHFVDISNATTSVFSNTANVPVNSFDGGALRYFYRVREFCQDEFNYQPIPSRYYIDENADNPFFCGSGSCLGGPQPGVPYILFNIVPGADVTYHEHGHFVDYDHGYFLPNDWGQQPHDFWMVTTNYLAWLEGWAEFYAAAANMYWYARELPDEIEDSPLTDYYQFLDDTQETLPSNVNRRKVEGAVASFFHSLWDGVETRAPGYSGDNDDIRFSGELLLNLMSLAELDACIPSPTMCLFTLESFRSAVLTNTDSKYAPSINALYDYIILESTVSPRPATPTSIQIYGDQTSRTLTWNDNTAPFSVVYYQGSCNYLFDPERNNEEGFRIFKKPGIGSWDGSLNGYTLITEVNSETTTWIDTADMSFANSYVVVAFNSGGNSVPKAEIKYNPPAYVLNPVANDSLKDIVAIEGTVNDLASISGFNFSSELDSFRIEWGKGENPNTWSKYGINQACAACSIFEDTLATWNTGVVESGLYTLRLVAIYGTDSFVVDRAVAVYHEALFVDINAAEGISSIQQGLDLAEMGDTIRVFGSGNYVENIRMKQTVHLVGIGGNVQIVGVGDSAVVTIENHTYPCFLEGFTIKHQNNEAQEQGRGILIDKANPIISQCTITENKARKGGGVLIRGNSRPHFQSCTISNNTTTTYGAASAVSFYSSGNDAYPTAVFSDCVISDNEAGYYSVAMSGGMSSTIEMQYQFDRPLTSDFPQPKFENCLIQGNIARGLGTAFYIRYCYRPEIINCVISDNSRADYNFGGIVYCSNSGVYIENCTIVYNHIDYGYGSAVEASGYPRPGFDTEIRNSIVAFNERPAIVIADGVENAIVVNCDMYMNSDYGSAPSDSYWVSIGEDVISENPAFCNASIGDYHLYAFSPCAPGVNFTETIGAFDVDCVPGSIVATSPDPILSEDPSVVFACPQGDAAGIEVTVDLDNTVMTRDVGVEEFTLDVGGRYFTFFDPDGEVNAMVGASSTNGYMSLFSHHEIGGYGIDSVAVLINTVPLLERAYMNIRSPDESGDGLVNVVDFASFGQSYPSPPNQYVYYRDYNADSLVNLIDYSMFGSHYGHQTGNPPVQVSPDETQQTDFEISLDFTEEYLSSTERRLYVNVTLENMTTFKAMCVSLRNEHPDLQFLGWQQGSYPNKVIVTPVTRDGACDLFFGILGSKTFVSSKTVLGRLEFEVVTSDTLEITQTDFEMLIGDVLLAESVGTLGGVAVSKHVPIQQVFHNSLSQNYPNPFNPVTTIKYTIKEEEHVSLKIYNIAGQLVRTLVDQKMHPQEVKPVVWNGLDNRGEAVASGVYFYRLATQDFSQTKKMMMLK